jgi:hypothetical protein
VSVSGLGILPHLVVAPAAYGGGVVAVRDRLSLYPGGVVLWWRAFAGAFGRTRL